MVRDFCLFLICCRPNKKFAVQAFLRKFWKMFNIFFLYTWKKRKIVTDNVNYLPLYASFVNSTCSQLVFERKLSRNWHLRKILLRKLIFAFWQLRVNEGTCIFPKLVQKYLEVVKASKFIKKRLQHRWFPVIFPKYFKKPIFTEHLWWLFLNIELLTFDHFVLQLY